MVHWTNYTAMPMMVIGDSFTIQDTMDATNSLVNEVQLCYEDRRKTSQATNIFFSSRRLQNLCEFAFFLLDATKRKK
jgi:hypothetical protein